MPSPTRIQTLSSHQYPSGKSTIDNPVTKTSCSQPHNQYDDLQIQRLIRTHERHYTRYNRQVKYETHHNKIIDYNTKHFKNRLFYNISSKILTKDEEHILALGLNFTIDNRQMTDNELLTNIDEYHKTLCKKYDSINMLKHTTEDTTHETKQPQEYIKTLT